jgi:hypothetical protein
MVPPSTRDPVSKKGFLIGENMNEIFPGTDAHKPELNRIFIADRLQEFGIDVELKHWLECDEDEVLRQLAEYSVVLEIGMDDLLEACGIEITNTGGMHEV